MRLLVQNLTVKRGATPVLHTLHFALGKGAVVAIVGPSGSGKTTLLEALAGRLFHSGTITIADSVRTAFVPQQHRFHNRSNTDTFYYQQRFNSFDADDAATVEDELPGLFLPNASAYHLRIRTLFGLEPLRHRRLLHLSNGEHKRLQLAKALMLSPGILLLDNPFTGLDNNARNTLEQCLVQLAADGLTILFTCAASRVPEVVQHVLVLDGAGSGKLLPAETFGATYRQTVAAVDQEVIRTLLPGDHAVNFNCAVSMKSVQVRYGNKQVLADINWQVLKGERWSLSGPNGAGKSTLLSLITADNPQAYANEIYLFDKRRGTGESIWDIKRKIGYVSPELHLNFEKSATVFETVASGFFDTIGLFRQVQVEQTHKVKAWLELLDLAAVTNTLLWQLPLGTQRLVLLARALVKQPPLLVLDEPLQGLDEQQSARFRSIIDAICAHTSQTLIFVTHYTEDLPRAVTCHLRLEEGRVIADV